ncbi:MAG TPA: hypothetical protein VEK57_28050 [Thermoanaerobaculia bacterium]|nr:hypothetical protein [Thermoanaerobaculia bacterium]
MKLTEADLQRLYQESTAPDDEAAACLDTDLLIRAAEKRLSEAERETVAGHIARCSECARGFRIARWMQTLDGRPPLLPRRRWAIAAVAAMLLLFVPALTWLALLRERDQTTIAALRKTLAERDRPILTTSAPVPAPTAAESVAELTRPQLETPIIDLDSDVTRGVVSAPGIIVPEEVDLFTAILHLDEPARGTIDIAIEGPARWSGEWRAATPVATLTLTLNRHRFPSGDYVVRTRAGGREASYRFRVDWR